MCTTGNVDCGMVHNCLYGSESHMYSLCLLTLTTYGLIKFKERMVAQLCVQNLGDTAGADRRWSDSCYHTNGVGERLPCVRDFSSLNIAIFMFTSFVPSYYIDPSLDLTQLFIFVPMVRDVQLISCTAQKSMFKA